MNFFCGLTDGRQGGGPANRVVVFVFFDSLNPDILRNSKSGIVNEV
jgi:hypothetical protein